ncbi:DUF4430 domain-containing protein [Patescibacteria group bacterium]|nr:DUF4430 domain-containing protein [Patescibacteria group bacterium]MBU1890191.1 DUF4430 domain-containing protein [Patescibacteria group bacterium]
MLKSKLYLLIAVAIGLMSGAVLGTYSTSTLDFSASIEPTTARVAGIEDVRTQSVLVIDFGDTQMSYPYQLSPETATSAQALLEEMTNKNNIALESTTYDFGTLITGIGGHTNGDNDNYWMFYVNEDMPMVGAGQYTVQPDDKIEFKFEAGGF